MHKITVRKNEVTYVFNASPEQSILSVLRESNLYIPAVCGERRVCGKCAIQLLHGFLDITDEDRMFFSEAELRSGKRLACAAYLTEDIEIAICASDEAGFKILSFYRQLHNDESKPSKALPTDKKHGALAIAIDIGTTTICFEVVNPADGSIVSSHSRINRQRRYGADVISRIAAANTGKLFALRDSIREDIRDGVTEALAGAGLRAEDVRKINIAANTVMIHLLLGISCQTLGASPFSTIIAGKYESHFHELFESCLCDCPVTILPPVSAFVGGDITAGILFCNAHTSESYSLLIDLGTNGEMALCRKNSIFCTSTAAGPAFEGGNISCGTGGIPGAISKIRYDGTAFAYETIGGLPPVGICGSGLMDAVACFYENGFIDDTGLLEDKYFESGVETAPGIFLTQKDIREFQLAKSAVRAGIEVLIKTAGISLCDIEAVYIAGSFGFHMNTDSAVKVGLVPREPAAGLVAIGNSSLGGCVKTLLDSQAPDITEKIALQAQEINLADNKHFNDLFMEHMYF